ncbi:hypothetical protein J6590_005153 [Homalodisca vitripennis]|nr:hypothetical protein J6590_005153 [Homalodisca vitripennis]
MSGEGWINNLDPALTFVSVLPACLPQISQRPSHPKTALHKPVAPLSVASILFTLYEPRSAERWRLRPTGLEAQDRQGRAEQGHTRIPGRAAHVVTSHHVQTTTKPQHTHTTPTTTTNHKTKQVKVSKSMRRRVRNAEMVEPEPAPYRDVTQPVAGQQRGLGF